MNQKIKYNTFALPYANGKLHLGHLYEATIADIYSRVNNLLLISGSDCHGSSITIESKKQNLDPKTIVLKNHEVQYEQYKKLKINLNNFSLTSSENHKKVLGWCVKLIKKNNTNFFVVKKSLSWYDNKEKVFLSERYVVGICPHCFTDNQYAGDECKKCLKFIDDEFLIDPISIDSKNKLIKKETNHLFINSEKFLDFCNENKSLINKNITSKIFNENLNQKKLIDISRDNPYFGISIDDFDFLDNQSYYVWFDAPIGYLTFAFEDWCKNKEFNENNFLIFLSNIKLSHFIGKDISYFHIFLWLNLFHNITGEQNIENIFIHGWILSDSGDKLSKSLGSSIDLNNFNEQQVDALRFWFFSIFKNSIEDKKLEDFISFYNKFCVDKF